MAVFIINSTDSKAIRKSEVLAYLIEPYTEMIEESELISGFQLLVATSRVRDSNIVFERAETLEELNPLVLAFHNAMEEE